MIVEVWLVIQILIMGDVTLLENSRQPDMTTCRTHREHAEDMALKIEDANFEFRAACQIVKKTDPA